MTFVSLVPKVRTFLPQRIPGPIAVLYEKVAAPGLRQFYRQISSEITSTLRSGRVLDVGTGPGHLLVEMSQHNPNLELVGFDLSRKMLKIAKRLTEQIGKVCASVSVWDPVQRTSGTNLNSGLIQLVRGDVRNLPFPDGAFDLVVSTLSMHHWRDTSRSIQECLRVTAPGGCCWIYELRTDVSVRTLARLLTCEGIHRLFLSCVFKFHGVEPRRYQPHTVASWLGGGVTVKAEMHPAYLKLNIKKQLYELQDKTIRSQSASSAGSASVSM